MNKKSNRVSRMIAIACISVFALTSVPMVTDSFADGRRDRGSSNSREYREHERRGARFERAGRRHERREYRSHRNDWREERMHVISRPAVRHRHVIKSLPWGYKRLWYDRRPYFFSRGLFYQPYVGGYLAVRSPVGAIVLSLPIGYQRHWIDGTTYYVYGGTFYRRVPAGYVVVEPPATVIVTDDAPEIISPAIPASGRVIVDAPVLNVRSGPSLDDKMIYQLDEGYILEVSGRSDGWLYVLLPNGEYGWVKSVFTKPLKPGNG